MDHSHIRAYFLAIVTTLLTVLTVYLFRPFLVTICLAGVFAVVFEPLNRRFIRHGKMPRVLAALLTLVVGVTVVAVILGFLSVQLFKEVGNVYTLASQPGSATHLEHALSSLGDSFNSTIPGSGAYFNSLSANVNGYVHTALGYGLAHAAGFFSGTLHFMLQLFVFLVTLYYLLKEGPNLRTAIARFSPLTEPETKSLLSRMHVTINSVVRGSLLIAFIQGALTAIGFLIFGIHNAVLWGTFAVVAALIPAIGVALVIVPGVLYLFIIGHTGGAIGLAIYGLFGVGIIDNFLRPQLVGGRASIHPLLILLSVLGGVAFFGAGGIFLGPLAISMLLGLLSLYSPSQSEPPPVRHKKVATPH